MIIGRKYLASTVSEVKDHLGWMVLSCPDDFLEPYEGQEPDTNESVFADLEFSLGLIRKRIGEKKYAALMTMAARAKAMYDAGEDHGACFMLQDMQGILRGNKDLIAIIPGTQY